MAGTPSPWETWTILFLAGLQLAVAYWWWRGPTLEGSRWWIVALFALNGAATVLNLGRRFGAELVLDATGGFLDRWSNFALLGFGLLALDVRRRWTRPRRAFLAAVGLLMVAGTGVWMAARLGPLSKPPWTRLATFHSLLLAIVVGSAALLRRFLTWDEGQSPLWGLALAGIGLRYAELSVWLTLPGELPPTWTGWVSFTASFGMWIALLSVVAAIVVGVWRYARDRPQRARTTYQLALALLLAGLLFGAGRSVDPDVTYLGVVFTLALVRPLVFAEVRSRLAGGHLWTSSIRTTLARGSCAYLAVILGLALATAIGLGFQGAHLTGAGLLPLGVLAGDFLLRRTPDLVSSTDEERNTGDEDWPLDPDEVTLPPDWRERLEAGRRRFRDLDPAVQDALAGLAHWQRILLVLEGTPDGDDLPPYERTTPGLHFRTHCPYASIGPEIRRANERARSIAEDLGVKSGPGSRSLALVDEAWGRAQGLDSPRVKHYELTPLGERVAAALREEIGLGDADPEDVARVVGEGFQADGDT